MQSTRRHVLPIFLSLLALPAVAEPEHLSADIVVYGDSPSAVSAAIEASESQYDVLLISPVNNIGGITIEGLGRQDVDHRSGNGEPIGGLTAEFYLRIARAYNPNANSPRYFFNSSVAEQVIDAWLAEKNITVIRGKRISEADGAVSLENGRITSFLCEDGTLVTGNIFIDGTVEGDLMAFAGVTYTWGREGNAKYGETVGGVINPSHEQQYKVAVDPYNTPGDPSSGLIHGVQEGEIGPHGAPDKSIMGFCLRLPLTKNPDNKIPITAPEGYDVSDYELYRRYFAAGGSNDWLDGPGRINNDPNFKLFDLGSWHDLSGNLYGRNHGYPTGTYAERQAIYEEHRRFTQGLIYYLSTDPSVPDAFRTEWAKWGLCADEFIDNGGWPRMLYIRSTRRMISDYVITEADVIERPKGSLQPAPPVADPIGICWWPVDHHAARTLAVDGKVYNEGGYIDYTNYKPFGIPYRSIVPKRADATNLLVPSALSASYAGYGAVRLEWTFMVLGQSAGAAAVIALEENLPVQDVPYLTLAGHLLARGQKLDPTNNIPPVAFDQSVNVYYNTPRSITLTANDVDPEDTLSYLVETNPSNGTLSGTPPDLTYTPNSNYSGSDSFTFKANDGKAPSNVATVSLTVLSTPNTPPIVNAGADQNILLDSAALWTPAAIATAGWYDASDAATITASSGQVSQWNDKSGNDRHAMQTEPSNRPTYTASDSMINNLPSIGTTATTGRIGLVTPSMTARNVYVVSYYGNGTNTNFSTFHTLLSGNQNAYGEFRVMGNNGTNALIDSVAFNNEATFKNGSTTSSLVVLPMPASILTLKSTAARTQTYALGFNQGSEPTTANRAWLGGYSEWVFTDGTEDFATQQKIEGYLAHKWGLSASLPVEHPYKSAAPSMSAVSVALHDAGVTDTDGDEVTATWSVVSKPAGSSVTFNNINLVNSTVTLSSVGTYVLRLAADDGTDQTFDEVTISVTQASAGQIAFHAWATAGGEGGEITFDGDANGDGVHDGMSWFLGADNPSEQASGLLPQAEESNGNLTLNFKMLNSSARGTAVLSLQHSMDLGVSDPWTSHTIPVPDVSGTVNGVEFTITPIEGTDHNQVFATIPGSAAGGTGKVFVRLSGVLSP